MADEDFLGRARACEQTRDYAGALAAYTSFLEARPGQAEAWVERGRVRLILEDRPGALADFSRAIELDERNVRAWYYRGYAQQSLDPAAALEAYRRACAIEPRDASEARYCDMAREALGRPKEAPADLPERKSPARKRSFPVSVGSTPVTWLIVAANIAVMAVFPELFIPRSTPEFQETLIRAGALERVLVWEGEVWRMFTAMFLHIGWMHLLLNMYGLVVLGGVIERAVGSARFLLVYLASGLGASAASLLCHHVVGAGASGAIFGVEGVFLALLQHRLGGWRPFFANPGIRNILGNMALWVVLGMTLIPMDNYAHGGGLFFGALAGALLERGPRMGPGRRAAAWGGALLLWAATLVLAAIPGLTDGGWRGYRAFQKAVQANREGKPQVMLNHCDEAIALGYQDADVHRARARALEELGRLEEADAANDEVIRRAPKWVSGYWGRGSVRFARKDYPGAIQAYTQALEIEPDHPDLLFNRALARWKSNDPAGATADFRKVLEVAPASWEDRDKVKGHLKLLEQELKDRK